MAAVGAFTSMDQAEDLKAFERRLIEYVSSIGPAATKWRVLLLTSCMMTAFMAWNWAIDQRTSQVSFLQSLYNHKAFTVCVATLITLFLLGAHKRIMAQSMKMWFDAYRPLTIGIHYYEKLGRELLKSMLARSKKVLQDFNMSCDSRGRIILKPRPAQQLEGYQRVYQGHG